MIKQSLHYAGVLLWFCLPLLSFSQNSILADGNWYKLSVKETGVYKITYDDLVSWGFDPAAINPENVAIYGNGNGMLPESPSEFRYDDLVGNAITVVGENDGSFDPADYVLFYAQGPTAWKLDAGTGQFSHETNLYSEEVFYFLNLNKPGAARIQDQFSTIIPATNFAETFTWHEAYEPELENLIHSGKMWFGDRFDGNMSIVYPLTIPNLVTDEPVHLSYQFAARSSETSTFNIYADGELLATEQVSMVNFNNSYSDFAKMRSGEISFYPGGQEISLMIEYAAPNDSATGWLDFFSLQATANLFFEEPQLLFSVPGIIGPSTVTEFSLENAASNLLIWNITDPLQPGNVIFDLNGSVAEYTLETDSLLQFIAFTGTDLKPEFIETVANQNLHGIAVPEMVIISAPEFESSANSLAAFRQSNDNLTVLVSHTSQIYNEFSSGAQDPTAIRDFMKYLYEKSGGENPKYLLLLGDASVDYKDRLENNTNFIPIWESEVSLNPVSSYCSDDFYGQFTEALSLDLAIGRIPAETASEAETMVQNIIGYASPENVGSWHNQFALIADDEDSNLHFTDAEELMDTLEMIAPYLNLSKIYLDAYPQVTLPDGHQRYPDVNDAINQRINDGVLAMTYIGHGGQDYLAHEQIMTPEDIQTWNNVNRMNVFMTFTCAFGRMDDPVFDPMMMELLAQENQGMVAVFTATRPTYAGANMHLNKNIQSNLIEHPDKPFGEIVRMAKNNSGTVVNKTKFVLFGDPAMRIAIPLLKVETDFIKETAVQEFNDTLHPGSYITLEGSVLDLDGNVQTDFSGEITIDVFDIPETIHLLQNDSMSQAGDFMLQDRVIKTVTANVTSGHWYTEFFLPNDMDSVYGNIKLSYYAVDGPDEASGYYKTLVGGLQAGIADEPEELEVLIYPTVANDWINVRLGTNTQNVTCIMTSITGQQFEIVRNHNYKQGENIQLDIHNLPDGFYILSIQTEHNQHAEKIIIQ